MKFVKNAVAFFVKQRILFCGIFLLSAFLTFFAMSHANFSENVYDILPVSDDTVHAHLKATKFFGQSKTLYFNISGENASAVSDILSEKLSAMPEIKEVSGTMATQDFRKVVQALLKFTPELFTNEDEILLREKIKKDVLEKRLNDFKKKLSGVGGFGVSDVLIADPVGVLDIFYQKLKKSSDLDVASFSDGKIISKDGKNFLILAEGNFDSSDSQKSAELISKIEKILKKLKNDFPSEKIAYAGGYRIATDNAKIASRDCLMCFVLTIILMSAICFFAFRSRIFMLFAVAPSLLGSAIAFAFMSIFYGRVASISVAFASIAVGVSIDYAIHILYKLDSLGKLDLSKVADVASTLARPIAMTAGTTAMAFVIIFFCGSEGFSQLGIFGVVGVITSALLSVFVMPAYAVGLGKISSKRRFFDLLAKGIFPLFKNYKLSIVVIVILSLSTLPFLFNLKINGDFSSLSALTTNARADDVLIRNVWRDAVSKTYILIDTKNAELTKKESKKIEKWLAENGVKYFPISNLVVDSNTKNENIKRWHDFWNDSTLAELKKNFLLASKSVGMSAKAFEKSISKYPTLADEKFDVLADDNLSKIFKGKLSADGVIALSVVLPASFDKVEFSKKLKEFSPCSDYIESSFLGEHIAKITFDWLIKFAMLAFVFAFGYIYFISHKIKFVFAVLLPVVFGLAWCFGILGMLGIQINIVSAIFVIFAVCVAQDYAVFLLHSSTSDENKISTLASVLLSAITTIFAFGTLAIAKHPMLNSLGISAGISIFSILCACILFSSISSKWLGKKQDER